MTFEKLTNNLNKLMARLKLNANELARQTGIPASSIKKIRTNNNPNPTLTTLMPLANYFSVTISQLIGDEPLPAAEQSNNKSLDTAILNTIPIISWNEIINWIDTRSGGLSVIGTERRYSPDTFGLIVEETAWERFSEGTILLIDPITIPEQNDLVIVRKNDQKNFSLKQFLIEDGDSFLKSILIDNHIIHKSDEFKILGVVMEYRKYLK